MQYQYSEKEYEKVLSYMEDEESKFIYTKRLEYSKSLDYSAINCIVDKYVPEFRGRCYWPSVKKKLLELLRNKKNIVLWGGGIKCKRLIDLLIPSDVKVSAIIDNDESIYGKEVNGIQIVGFAEINFAKVDCLIITPGNLQIVDQIYEQAVGLGMKEDCIIKYIYYSKSVSHENEYFDKDIISFEKQEVFIDAGVLNLNTSMELAKRCIKNGTEKFKIYAFEPDRKSYTRCQNICMQHKDMVIQLYEAGLWSYNTTLYFTGTGTGNSRIVNDVTETKIKVVALDNCVSYDKVTFIKMDIEGAELEALKGAQKIIQRDKPKLAIAVYHKKEDIVQIPLYIKALVPEYKLYLRHYSNCAVDTVLYAVL